MHIRTFIASDQLHSSSNQIRHGQAPVKDELPHLVPQDLPAVHFSNGLLLKCCLHGRYCQASWNLLYQLLHQPLAEYFLLLLQKEKVSTQLM